MAHTMNLNPKAGIETKKAFSWHSNAFSMTKHEDDFAGYSHAYEMMNGNAPTAFKRFI